ncbi:hypothetical protein Kfla_1354 [Kribbella flavida DSM 17836]|uniref:Lipoprotein n=1 Tax=Kribbella flavida (strain DSM 17836 / JCM 10339 / NBRC 14399) TaxID=479435 RepID=D2PKE4_KRIFD|nr:hypothetical protein [Kribbella flavida]ADB30456.1 hypothetical protein Kfla_1354 [Kribbella flavida DSM 17836]
MRRTAPGVTALIGCALLALAGCAGGNAGAATTGTPNAGPPAPSAPPAVTPKSALAVLVVVPKGYPPHPRELSGPFTLQSFLGTLSAIPAEDRALLLNASFTEGYQASRISPDRKKQYTVRLFKTGSKKKAKDLQLGFWNQETHSGKFAVRGVPGVLSGRRIAPTGGPDESEAVAEVSFVVGTLVARISVRETGPVSSDLTPDTTLAATVGRQQYARLSSKSG